MSIDEQVAEYMEGFLCGVDDAYRARCVELTSDDPSYVAGHNAGRAAYLAAEQAERERIERCPACGGKHGWFDRGLDPLWIDCPACHGTGRRAP